MSSKKQIAANRRNAQKSTGPRFAEGKARSKMKALKSGIYAEEVAPSSQPPYNVSIGPYLVS
jgi:hypothetical protein